MSTSAKKTKTRPVHTIEELRKLTLDSPATKGKKKIVLPKPKLVRVRVKDIHVDTAYQRILKIHRCKAIAADFKPDKLGIPATGLRKNGQYWMVDGQHRLGGLTLMGVEWVWVNAYESSGRQYEALLFKELNSSSVSVSHNDKHIALTEAGDLETLAINKAIERCGYTINLRSSSRPMHIYQILPLLDMAAAGNIDHCLTLVALIWPEETLAYQSQHLRSFCYFMTRVADCTKDSDIIRGLAGHGAAELRARGKVLSKSFGSGARIPYLATAMAQVCDRTHKRRSAKTYTKIAPIFLKEV